MQLSSFLNNKVSAAFLGLLTFAGMLASIESALAADMVAPVTPTYTDAGICGHQHVLSSVSYKFYHEVRHVPDLPVVRIKEMTNIGMTRYEPAATKLNIARQYCSATAVMNDGTSYPVWYMVEFGQGFTGIGGFNVEFCVEGFDKWRIQDGNCRAVR